MYFCRVMKRLVKLLVLLILLMCGSPAMAGDDCCCDVFTTAHHPEGSEHATRNHCSCSPFVSCDACSGFIIPDFLHEPDVDIYFLPIHPDFQVVLPLVFLSEGGVFEDDLPSGEVINKPLLIFFHTPNGLRGSPLIS